MGSGRFDANTYASTSSSTAAFAASAGISTKDAAFRYSRDTMAQPRTNWKVHELLDPLLIKDVRESRDSVEHPTTLPIAVFFDVTGSMRSIPQVFQEKMEKLMTELTVNGKIEHPHVLFGAIGDAYSDRIPFQVGQFESDNRGDEQLRNVVLEAGGGGSISESYELALYFAAYKTSIDSWDKRQKKGYLFTLGDERFYSTLPKSVVKSVFGDDVTVDLTFEDLLKTTTERFEYFHFHAVQGSYANDPRIIKPWQEALGQRFIMLDDSAMVCEAIAGVVSIMEGATFDTVDSSVAKAISSIKPPRLINP
jgi:hypothetical protein